MPVNGNIAPKSIVIGVADPIPQRGRRNCSPRQRERPAVLPGFLPPACNPRDRREQGRSIRFKRQLVEPATWGSGQRWLDCSWATWAPYNGRHGLLFNEKISRPWKRNLSK